MKRQFNRINQYVQDHRTEIFIINGVVVSTAIAVIFAKKYYDDLAVLKAESDEAKEILTMIWESYVAQADLDDQLSTLK